MMDGVQGVLMTIDKLIGVILICLSIYMLWKNIIPFFTALCCTMGGLVWILDHE